MSQHRCVWFSALPLYARSVLSIRQCVCSCSLALVHGLLLYLDSLGGIMVVSSITSSHPPQVSSSQHCGIQRYWTTLISRAWPTTFHRPSLHLNICSFLSRSSLLISNANLQERVIGLIRRLKLNIALSNLVEYVATLDRLEPNGRSLTWLSESAGRNFEIALLRNGFVPSKLLANTSVTHASVVARLGCSVFVCAESADCFL